MQILILFGIFYFLEFFFHNLLNWLDSFFFISFCGFKFSYNEIQKYSNFMYADKLQKCALIFFECLFKHGNLVDLLILLPVVLGANSIANDLFRLKWTPYLEIFTVKTTSFNPFKSRFYSLLFTQLCVCFILRIALCSNFERSIILFDSSRWFTFECYQNCQSIYH